MIFGVFATGNDDHEHDGVPALGRAGLSFLEEWAASPLPGDGGLSGLAGCFHAGAVLALVGSNGPVGWFAADSADLCTGLFLYLLACVH